MTLSNTIMYFIVLTAGTTLYRAGLHDVQTAEQAARALKPLAGPAAALLFTTGIVATGMLGIPVLAGSAAYAVAEGAAWRRGMDEPVERAAYFYGVLAAAMLIGMGLSFTRINPIRLLFWSAVVNGLLAPPLIVLVLLVCNHREAMGDLRNGWGLNALGIVAALLMTGAAVALLWSWR
jgi:Mn2+/Fe2+ NRAMP family transporter